MFFGRSDVAHENKQKLSLKMAFDSSLCRCVQIPFCLSIVVTISAFVAASAPHILSLAATLTRITFGGWWDAGLSEFRHTSHGCKTINRAAYCTCEAVRASGAGEPVRVHVEGEECLRCCLCLSDIQPGNILQGGYCSNFMLLSLLGVCVAELRNAPRHLFPKHKTKPFWL